ncbi:MAG: uncharacterized protein PWR16_1769 [Methanoculleus sp.]|nr:uncharacterized protein [Methanoculleus sp.]
MDEETTAMLDHVRTALHESGAHGFDHTERVVRLCEEIGAREGADMAVLIPAALFHDIARPLEEETGVPHEEEGARIAESYLRSIRYPKDRIAAVVHAIRAHRYSSGIAPETLEARVLSDADNLDAMGAVGIARTFMQAATGRRAGAREDRRSSSATVCKTGDQEDRRSSSGIADATSHFHEKLLNLKDLMHTESARNIAEKRHAFLVAFIETLDDEMGARIPPDS